MSVVRGIGSSFFVAVVLLTSVCNFASASTAKNAIVDMQRIETESLAVIDLVNKLQDKQVSIQDGIKKQSASIQRRARELEGKRGVLSVSAIEENRKSLENELVSLQNEAQMQSELIQKVKADSLSEVDSMIRSEVAIAANKKYDSVVAKQLFLYFDSASYEDITSTVIAALNAKKKSIDIDKYFGGPTAPTKKSVVAKNKKK